MSFLDLTELEEIDRQISRTVEVMRATIAERMRPPPNLTVSQWADRFRKLSAEASAEPGQWITARNEPMRGVMDAVSDPAVHTVVVVSSAQVGKTETLSNIIGYHVAQDPAPILLLQPTLEMGEAYSKDRLAPMVRDTPALKGKIKDPRARDSGNTLLHKTFPGGHITIAGANSPASLASRPIRIVLADEVDRYPPSAGTEGDPVSLARKRSTTFWNRKTVLTSTPTVKGISRIEAEWEISDKRRFHVRCEDCGHSQHLKWAQVKWPEGKPAKAEYVCEKCGTFWDDSTRWRVLRHGEWIATAQSNGTAGFHLNEIYSPWVKLGDMAQAFLDAKRSPETLKTWINTSLGESFEEDAERVDGHSLMERLEDWDKAPNDVLAITCGVDTQDDRLEVERVGWGVEEESWSLEHRVIYGDPSGPEIWRELDDYLLTNTLRQDGTELPVHAVAIDSGGHHTAAVHRFCKDRFRRRVYAIKGVGGPGKPIWPKRASKNNKARINQFLIGVDAGKDAIYARLKIKDAGPGYCHYPKGREAGYFEQLTAEVVQTKYLKGFPTRVYVLPPGRRNEALDIRVYAYAALQSLNVRWGHLLAAQQRQAQRVVEDPPKQADHVQEEPAPAQQAGVFRGRRGRSVRRSNWMS